MSGPCPGSLPPAAAPGPAPARRLGRLTVLTLLAGLLPALAGQAVGAELVDIRWPGDGRYVHQASIAPGKFVELCGKLPAGLKVRWHFDADQPLDVNVHYHLGKQVVFPFKRSAVAQAGDTLDAQTEQDYCWMWTNKSPAPAALSVTLQR